MRYLITPVGYVPETLVREGKMQCSTLQIVVGFVSCLVTAILLHQLSNRQEVAFWEEFLMDPIANCCSSLDVAAKRQTGIPLV